MPQNRLQNHSLASLFEYQISRKELSIQLSKAIELQKKGIKKYFSVSVPHRLSKFCAALRK